MDCSQAQQYKIISIILKKLLALVVAGSILVPITSTYASDEGADSCDQTLKGKSEDLGTLLSDSESSDQVFQASMEEISLMDLVSADPEVNLAVQHPFVIMTAAQRIYSFIQSQGFELKNVRGVGEVKIYNIFSVPSEMNGGKIIVGHEREIEKLVDSIKDAIDGSVKVPFLVGPSGTGKTLIQDIFRKALAEVTLNYTQQYYYTFEWRGLDQIPAAAEIYPSGTYRAPLNDSPITLLPKETQNKVVNFASQHLGDVIDVVGEMEPIPSPDPHSKWIRQRVLEHYSKENGGRLTSEKEIIEALDKHIIVRRQILGNNGSAPVMDSQGRDYNQGDLLLSKDPVNSLIAPNKTKDEIAWNFGLVPGANGSVLFLDEFPRNDKTLRDIFLRIFEGHEVAISGAPVISIDALIIAAGNYESLENLTGAEDSRAHRDRVRPIPFNWSIYPHKIAMTLLYMYGNVFSRDLSDSTGDKQKADLLQIFPRTMAGEDYKSSDGRYELWLGKGQGQVHLSPHALMLMSNIVASTRIHFDGAEAIKKENTYTAMTSTYQHPVERVKYLTGRVNLSPAEEEEMKAQSMLQQEGHFGLSARDAAAWLRESAHVASQRGGDITPSIVLETFRRMLDENALEKDSRMTSDPEDTRRLWKNIADLISYQILLPDLQLDFNSALAKGTNLAENTYDEILQEIIAEGNGLTEYMHPVAGSKKSINEKRLKEIKSIYEAINKKTLDTPQIANFFSLASRKAHAGGKMERDMSLMATVNQFYAKKTTENLDLIALNNYALTGQGEASIMSSYDKLSEALKAKGYSDVGIRETLNLVEELENKIAQAKQRQQ